jgi:hypothetical protein
MKKETFTVSDNLINVIFVKPDEVALMFGQNTQPFKSPTPVTPEKELLNHQSSLGIKVQSVLLPKEHQLFAIKSEVEVLDWLQNKVKSVHTANYILRLKYEEGQIIKLKYADLLSRNE